MFLGSTPHDKNEYYFTADIVAGDRYPHDVHNDEIPEGYRVIRQVLADAPDNSVVIIQLGFSTNTAELLQSGPDDISPLTGQELVRNKARLLSVMGGRNASPNVEFNIGQHITSARTVFDNWPLEILQSDGDLGQEILYPLSSIMSDFDYVTRHPVKESYLNKDFYWHENEGSYYNMRSWDLTAVMAAIENPADYFAMTEPGTVSINRLGHSTFKADPDGLHRSLGAHWDLSRAQKAAISNRLIELVPEAP